jgi:hypothetical protein
MSTKEINTLRQQVNRVRKLNEQQTQVLNNVSALLDIAENAAANERFATFGHPTPNDEVKPRVRKANDKPLTADDVLDIVHRALTTYPKAK